MHTTVCRVSRPLVRLEVVDQKEHSPLVARHAGFCLRCQAERAIETRIRKTLSSLGENVIMAPAGLIPAVVGSLDAPIDYPEAETGSNTDKVAIAAAVIGVASVVAWTLSRRARGT